MGTVSGLSTQVVLQNLLICVILFYTVYYVALGMYWVMLKVSELDVLAPSDFKTNLSWLNTNYKVLLVSSEITYFVCGLLFVLVVEEWVWDYGISVTIFHVAITSTVMLEFPLTSHWWAALAATVLDNRGGSRLPGRNGTTCRYYNSAHQAEFKAELLSAKRSTLKERKKCIENPEIVIPAMMRKGCVYIV
ncbi:putative transmembrane protein 244 [Mesoplodon densirostris]|uniref:putative transmembrane protein 244 n=1 Tax=Mesoplodon densirostris TaxID=48708 RepID=UPI0028DCD40B|nr:putative transmembrane protein 244 [Mesoplodon densirostris]